LKTVVFDIEANSLTNPTQIWVVVCKDLASGQVDIFRKITENEDECLHFLDYAKSVGCWIGHNCLEYDFPVLDKLIPGFSSVALVGDVHQSEEKTGGVLPRIDTLILSRLIDYSRENGHSIEAYGEEFGLPKIAFNDFSKYAKEMEVYCARDVDICSLIFAKYRRIIDDPNWRPSIVLEHQFQLVVNSLHDNGFCFDSRRARVLLERIEKELGELDKEIHTAFPLRTEIIKEVHPRRTKYGTLNRRDFIFHKDGDLSAYTGDPFTRFKYVPFNPSSHKQLVDVLNNAGWSPVEKTKTHKDVEREINILKHKTKTEDIDKRLELLYNKMKTLSTYGYTISEENLSTLPAKAPGPARILARRILLESRRRTLTEWIGLVQEDGRIHGKFLGIGAWTHRMAHQKPNCANIPNEKDEQGRTKLYGKEFRSLWIAPKKRLLVGVDAEGIQLRVFAHYINDKEFTDALVNGSKAKKTDPHSLNQRVLGNVCRHRQAAKRFIYALLLGAGLDKLAEILECTRAEAQEALDRLLQKYTGFAYLKKTIIPQDSQRGYFIGLDGRGVYIPGTTQGQKAHLCMSGYLQNGEAVIMKRATIKWHDKLKSLDAKLVNLVHDEWQTETSDNMEVAIAIAKMQADSLREVGEDLKLNCPLSGAYYDEDRKDYTIGVNWKLTH
jgi:DNA polymerase I